MRSLSGRQYTTRLIASLLVYAVLLAASIMVLQQGLAQPWRTLISLVPVLPMLYIVMLVVARFRSLDEYWQQVQLMALPIAFLGSLLAAFSWGFIENAGFERLSGFAMFGVMCGLYLIGLLLARRRYA